MWLQHVNAECILVKYALKHCIFTRKKYIITIVYMCANYMLDTLSKWLQKCMKKIIKRKCICCVIKLVISTTKI